MGTRNRQRRAEKRRKRERPATGGRPRRDDSPPFEQFDPLLVRGLLLSAADAFRNADLEFAAALVAGLDEGAQDRRGHRMVDDGLGMLLAEAIRGVWQRGWQPADIARLLDRKVGPRHGRYLVDVVAATPAATPARRSTPAGAISCRRWAPRCGGPTTSPTSSSGRTGKGWPGPTR